MKLLLDENLSDRVVSHIRHLYPDSTHVKQLGLTQTSDTLIWSHAKQHGYLVSKDADFHQRSLVLGHPPKVVFLRIGNCPTDQVIHLLRINQPLMSAFESDSNASILVLQ